MMDELKIAGPFANRSQWFDPLNVKAFNGDQVLSILRDLVHRSVAYLFEGGEKPCLSRPEAKALQPLFGGDEWAREKPQGYLGFLNSVLYFTGKDADFRSNLMVLATGAMARSRFVERLALRKKAKGSGLVGGLALAPVMLEVAVSDPSLQMHLLAGVRDNWRKRTVLYPDDIDWPDHVSMDLILILLLLALSPQGESANNSHGRFLRFRRYVSHIWLRPVRHIEAKLNGWLPLLLEAVTDGPEIEQLILADAIARNPHCLGLEPVGPFCARSRFARCFGWQLPDVVDDETEADAEAEVEAGPEEEAEQDKEQDLILSPATLEQGAGKEESSLGRLGERLAGGLL